MIILHAPFLTASSCFYYGVLYCMQLCHFVILRTKRIINLMVDVQACYSWLISLVSGDLLMKDMQEICYLLTP